MQQLKRWDRVAVGVVGVQVQRPVAVSQVAGLGLDADVEQPAVVGLADEAEPLHRLLDHARSMIGADEDREAPSSNPRQHFAQGGIVAEVVGEGYRLGLADRIRRLPE
jgi:hypothetical protein